MTVQPPKGASQAPLDTAGVLWVAALDRVAIEERVEWVKAMEERVAEINTKRASEPYAIRNIVGRWLRLRGQFLEGSFGLSEFIVPRDRQAQLFTQLAADADHSDLLVRLLKGEEPLPFDEWKQKAQR